MKKLSLSLKSLQAMLLMLCVSMVASAQTVEIDGVFYQLMENPIPEYDEFGVYIGESYERSASVTYDPSFDMWMDNKETYQGDLIIPDKVQYNGADYPVVSVGYCAFCNCKSLNSVQLPQSVSYIDYAFTNCSNLTSVSMPGISNIASGVFNGCDKLTSLHFPKTITNIDNSLFSGMANLSSITVDEDNNMFKSVDGVLYDKNVTKIVGFPVKKGGSYKIPATITTVNTGSFPNNVLIDELIVPATVTKIEDNVFGYNHQIRKLTIEDGDAELTLGFGSISTSFIDEKGVNRTLYISFPYSLQELYWGRPLKYNNVYCAPFAQTNLNKVTFGTKVTSIPKYTFYNCYNLNTVDVKGGIGQWCNFDFTELYTSPFSCYDMMMGVMPGEEPQQPKVTFNGTELSGAVVIPDEVTSIPSHGFQYGCSGITDLTIPAAVTSIADGAFKGLSSLSTIQLAVANTNFILDDNVLYNKEKTKILCFPPLRDGDYTVPATVTELGDYQFYNCIYLTSVTLPNTIKTIGKYAFAGCAKLSTFTIPASIETINNNAFDDCISLSNLLIEEATTPLQIGTGSAGIFASCPIKDVFIGRSIGTIYTYNNFTPFNVSYLVSVHFGKRVTNLFENFFLGCSGIKEVYFDGTLVDWCNITFPNEYATPFGAHMYRDYTMDPDGSWRSNGPSRILYVRMNPQPDPNVEYYPVHSQVNIPEGATKVGAYAFFGQNGVTNVTVPSTVTTIEKFAFVGVNEVYINATNVINISTADCFDVNTKIYVPDEVVEDYRNAAVWSTIKDRIYPKGFLTVTVDLIAMSSSPALLPALNALERVNGEYRINALTNLKIRGTMNGWDILMIRNKMPNLQTLDLSEATILDNDGGQEYYTGYHTTANTISAYSFYKLKNLCKVILPQNITSIDYSAFEECSNLKEVLYIPETCTYIGSRAFANSGLTSIVIGKNVKTIGSEAFWNCDKLVSVTFLGGLQYDLQGNPLNDPQDGLQTIEDRAFSGCTSLYNSYCDVTDTYYNIVNGTPSSTSLAFPSSLKKIGGYAFYGCSSLTNIDFAEGLTEIGYNAFSSCYNLQDLHLPTSLRRIESYAFNGCNNLNVVHVPSMLESIGDYAFTNCGLRSVYAYTVVPIQINQNTFDYSGVELYAPDNSFYAYYLNTQWSQFLDVLSFPAIYSDWYTPKNTDLEINVQIPIKGNANGKMEPGSGLIITGNGEQLVKKLILEWYHGANYPSLIENGNLSVEELKFIMNVYPYKWYFFCFPCDIEIKNFKFGGKGKYVWRYYDPKLRAEGKSGWVNFTGDVLKAGVGYIYQCNVEGDLELPVFNPDNLERTNDGTATDKDVNLVTNEAANPQDASWNFVGNPNLSYYSLDDLAGEFNSPITVWDDEQQTYTAVVPGDDEYNIHPFQAFFIQKPTDSEGVTFKAENRATYSQATANAAARRRARAAMPADENHIIVNVEISNGKSTDKTRVVFDDSKSLDYEIGTDANKMMSMAEVPQVYTLDNKNVKYAVNNRPNKGNEVRLGFSVPADGNYTISALRMDIRMALKDNATGTIHDFGNGAYSFQAEAGTNDTRFALVAAQNVTSISENGIEGLDIVAENGGIRVSGVTDQPVYIYNVKGIRVATLTVSGNISLTNGTYIVSVGDKTTKILVK